MNSWFSSQLEINICHETYTVLHPMTLPTLSIIPAIVKQLRENVYDLWLLFTECFLAPGELHPLDRFVIRDPLALRQSLFKAPANNVVEIHLHPFRRSLFAQDGWGGGGRATRGFWRFPRHLPLSSLLYQFDASINFRFNAFGSVEPAFHLIYSSTGIASVYLVHISIIIDPR